MRRLAQAVALLLPGHLLAVALLAAGDALRLAPAAARFVETPVDVLAAIATLLGVYGLSALLALLLLAGGLALAGPQDLGAVPGALRGGLIDVLRRQTGEPRRGAWALATLLALGALALIGYRVTLFLVDSFNTARLVALAAVTSLLVLGGLALLLRAVLAALLCHLARLPGLRHLVHARSALLVVALLGLALAGVAVVEERALFKEIDGWRLYLTLGAALLVPLSLPLLPRSVLRALRPRAAWPWWVALAALILVLAGGVGLAPFDLRARAWLVTSSRTLAPVLSFWSARLDLDGDGVPWLLGGGDCDEWDPYVYPGAIDIPDNGVDEDCFDGDLQRPPPLPPAPPAAPLDPGQARPDVILFSIDGCRRDALGVYGAGAGRTPHLDAFASGAVVLEDAVAPSSWTMPSFVGLMTSRFPSELPGFYAAVRATRVPGDLPLLQTPFARAGYRTVAITTGLQLDRLGLDRDLDEWRALSRDPKGSLGLAVAEAGAEVLRSTPRDRPLLLWLHLIDLHFPYEPPAEHRRFGSDKRALYAAELHYADAAFATVQRAVDETGRGERSVIMVFADHGEAFGEHGLEFHGHTTYAEETRVPWLIRAPGVAPRRVPDLVGVIDLAPTLWQLAGLEVRAPTRGRSLVPLLLGQALPERPLLVEQTRYLRDFSLVTPRYQLRHDQTRNHVELFDRAADPAQTRNLASALPHVATELRRELNRQLAPIAYLAGQRLGQVLLRALPADATRVDASFVEGPRLEALQVRAPSPRRLELAVVFAASGPVDGTKAEIELVVQDADGRRLGATKREATDGVYPPARWRPGDHVRHEASLNLSRDLALPARLCVGLLVDKVPRPAPGGAVQLCLPLPAPAVPSTTASPPVAPPATRPAAPLAPTTRPAP